MPIRGQSVPVPAVAGGAMLVAPIRSSFSQTRFPRLNGHMGHFEDDDAVRPRREPRTALMFVEMGQTTSESIFPHSASSLPPFSLCQRRGVLRGAAALWVTAAPSVGNLGGIGTGSITRRAARGFEARPAARIKQGARVSIKNHYNPSDPINSVSGTTRPARVIPWARFSRNAINNQ